MSNREMVTAAVLSVLLLTVLSVSCVADDSSASADVQVADMGSDSVSVKAGSQASFDVIITNSAAVGSDGIIVVMTTAVTDGSGKSVSDISSGVSIDGTSSGYAVLSAKDMAVFNIHVKPDTYAECGDYTLTYTYSVFDMAKNPLENPVSVSKVLKVASYTDSEGYYNKFLGVFPNTFSGVLGDSWFTALVSLVATIAIGVVVAFVAAPLISRLMTVKDEPGRASLRRTMFRLFVLLFVVFAASRSMAVLGIEGEDYSIVNNVFLVVYALVVAFIVWKIYNALLDRISYNISKRKNDDFMDNFQSFKPLFQYIGKIIIALVTVFSVMGTLGVDMSAIITSAGLVTLGITFGAQQILSQFFAGLLILTTRPFKKGDLVQLGSSVVYRVRKVNVMNTELVNWDNSDVTIVPNNTLTSSNVKNLTRDTLRTKLYIYVGVSYGTNMEQAMSLMVDAAKENPHVITDGSSPVPSSSLEEFGDSTVQMRLDVWIDNYNDYIDISSEIRKDMFEKFKAAGVSIDYPQIVVHQAERD